MYTLIGSNGKPFLSTRRGTFGGHRRLRIYGRLDCPSALRFISRGQYVKHRVFFSDEATAVAAGYRPCARCMPEAYKKWKAACKHAQLTGALGALDEMMRPFEREAARVWEEKQSQACERMMHI